VKPTRSETDYQAALAEIERLWWAKAGTAEGGLMSSPPLFTSGLSWVLVQQKNDQPAQE
jgi:hypothetical protein